MKKNIENKLDLFSNDSNTSKLIEQMKLNKKNYERLTTALSLLGNFDNQVEIELYDVFEKDDEKKERIWCSDKDENIFIFYASSTDKKDLLKIKKDANDKTLDYDISLAKKFKLNKDNIEYTRSGNITNFKYGRFITDNKELYSIFMSENLGYQIIGDFDIDISELLISKLNKLDHSPMLIDIVKIIEEIKIDINCNFSEIRIDVFKDFKEISSLNITNELEKPKEKIKKECC